jgi:hypothetical protein
MLNNIHGFTVREHFIFSSIKAVQDLMKHQVSRELCDDLNLIAASRRNIEWNNIVAWGWQVTSNKIVLNC